jgi:hypothetical protein
MKYILSHKLRGTSPIIELTQAKNMLEATYEALVFVICDHWGIKNEQPIDFNNFGAWLVNWLQTTSYWDIETINENYESNKQYYGSLKEYVLENLNVYEWDNRAKIYEVNDEKNIAKKLIEIKNTTICEEVYREIEKNQLEKEKQEYERLKNKFEKA